ncbi:GM19335 [Drosophila sechellia]|uniref:GM19335 n=1 Tax=Drosophila sechellia TaxID=7238 RepID=B4IKV3_DROSE|nr:GM19335 [Drosophila sechellia]
MTLGPDPTEQFKQPIDQIRTEHLNPEERQVLFAVCNQFRELFYDEGGPSCLTYRKHSLSEGEQEE